MVAVRRDLDAASPIVTIDTQRLENSSTVSIESVLNQMPQFVPDNTQFDSQNVGSGAQVPGIATVNLRGIGANRTLVLIDGARVSSERRVGPSASYLDPAILQGVDVARGARKFHEPCLPRSCVG